MNLTASSRGPERDAIYIEYNVKPLGVGDGRSCSRMLTNRKQPSVVSLKSLEENERKKTALGQSLKAEE